MKKALKNIEWLQDVFVTRKENQHFEVDTLIKNAFNEAIKELESLKNRKCSNCLSKRYCDVVTQDDDNFYCSDWEPK